MSHRKILMERLSEMIEAGHYRVTGTPRAMSSPGEENPPDKLADKPAPAPRAEPEKRPEASAEVKRGTPSPEAYVQGLAEKRRGAVEDGVRKSLDERFKGKR